MNNYESKWSDLDRLNNVIKHVDTVSGKCPYCEQYFILVKFNSFISHVEKCSYNIQKKMCASCILFEKVGLQNEYTLCKQKKYKNISQKSIKNCWRHHEA